MKSYAAQAEYCIFQTQVCHQTDNELISTSGRIFFRHDSIESTLSSAYARLLPIILSTRNRLNTFD